MTLPPVIRIFFALDFTSSIKKQLSDYICTLKKRAKTHAVRWSRPENLHITLQFLAEVKSEELELLLQSVRSELQNLKLKTHIHFGKLKLFPNPYRPRVIVLDVTPQEELARLSQKIGQGIQIANYAIEERPFRGHMTLGRIKNPQSLNLEFIYEVAPPEIEAIAVEEVVLFRSEPQPEGSCYSVLERIPLLREPVI